MTVDQDSFNVRPPGKSRYRRRWARPRVVVSSASTLFVLLALAVCLWGLPYFGVDLAVSHAVQELPAAWTTRPMHVISLAGDDAIEATALVALASLALLLMKARREAVVLIGAVLVSQILKIGIKNLIGRPRPTPELVNVLFSAQEIFSFPSGHTVHYTVFFGFLFCLAFMLVKSRTLRWFLCAFFGRSSSFWSGRREFTWAHIGLATLSAATFLAGQFWLRA